MSVSLAGGRHAQALLGSLGRLLRTPLATALTLLVIALALALPAALAVLLNNARLASGGLAGSVTLSVYFKTGVPLAQAEQLAARARARPDVAHVELISAEQGLQEFRRYSGFGSALDALKDNPLPHAMRVEPQPAARDSAGMASLQHYLSAWPEVDLVQLDAAWLAKLNAFLQLLARLLILSAALLGAGVLGIVGNTIRLEILNRREEIEVVKLVGGSNAFVRRPFLYTGLIYGLAGAALAVLLVQAGVWAVRAPVMALAQLYASSFTLQGLSAPECEWLLASGAILGWLAAWVSAAHHLRRIEPRA
jgi:cell division transport system permease protein